MTAISNLIAAFWRGYLAAVAEYAYAHPPADIEQIMEGLGWSQAQDDLVDHDPGHTPSPPPGSPPPPAAVHVTTPQSRTVLG